MSSGITAIRYIDMAGNSAPVSGARAASTRVSARICRLNDSAIAAMKQTVSQVGAFSPNRRERISGIA